MEIFIHLLINIARILLRFFYVRGFYLCIIAFVLSFIFFFFLIKTVLNKNKKNPHSNRGALNPATSRRSAPVFRMERAGPITAQPRRALLRWTEGTGREADHSESGCLGSGPENEEKSLFFPSRFSTDSAVFASPLLLLLLLLLLLFAPWLERVEKPSHPS